MSRAQYWTLTAFSILGFVLGVMLLFFGFYNQSVEKDLTANQNKVARLQQEAAQGELSRRVLENVVGDLSAISGQKPEVQSLLSRYGITVRKNNSQGQN